MSQTLADVVTGHARTRPDGAAIIGPDGTTLTWRRLLHRAAQVANALVAAGVGHGDRVGHLDKNDPTFFEVALGCNLVGAVVVGMNWRLSPRELEQIAGNADLSLLVAGEEFLEQVPADLRASGWSSAARHTRPGSAT